MQYEVLPGWKSNTAGLTSFSALPPNAQAYVHMISQLVQVPSESQKLLWEVHHFHHHSLLLFAPRLYGPHPHIFAFTNNCKYLEICYYYANRPPPPSLSLSLSLSFVSSSVGRNRSRKRRHHCHIDSDFSLLHSLLLSGDMYIVMH